MINYYINLFTFTYTIGFTPALLNIGSGKQAFEKKYRDGHRTQVDSPELCRYLFEVLKPHLPSTVCIENNQGI